MNKEQRDQVREMLHDILSGYHVKVDAQNTVTNAALKAMNIHFTKLNGAVAENRKIIDANLPHTIVQCPQASTIEKLRDNMVSRKAIISAVLIGIGSMGTFMSILFVIYRIITKTP